MKNWQKQIIEKTKNEPIPEIFKQNNMKTKEDQDKTHRKIAQLIFCISVMYFIFSNI